MAKRVASASSPEPANLSAAQIRAAIPKLERRLRELEAVEINNWNDDIKRDLDTLQVRVERTLAEIFGQDTPDYRRFQVHRFEFTVSLNIMHETSPQEWLEGYRECVADAITKVRNAVSLLEEELDDMGESPGGQALRAYEGLELQPEIDRAAGKLYRDGHYANAIEDAVKALNGLVRLRSGVEDADGSKLMERVFNADRPVLRFNPLADQSDRDEQRGFMMMFSGAVAGLRNPRAHKLIQDDPERALEFIAYVSLLAKLLDQAEKISPG